MPIPNRVLFLGSGFDQNVPPIIDKLLTLGVAYSRICLEDLPSRSQVQMEYGTHADSGFLVDPRGVSIPLHSVRSVYWSGWAPFDTANVKPVRAKNLAMHETRYTVWALIQQLGSRYWMNHPTKGQAAICKFKQYQAAQAAGLRVPTTLVTQNPDAAARFLRLHRRVVLKTIGQGGAPESAGRLIVTTVLEDSARARRQLERVRVCPTLFQECLTKDLEFRVTVVGRKVYAAAMDSKLLPDDIVDSRIGFLMKNPYVPWKLPSKIEAAAIDVTSRLGLTYGAIDLVLDRDGRFNFLEINPSGQWRAVEEMTGLPITEGIARELATSNADAN